MLPLALACFVAGFGAAISSGCGETVDIGGARPGVIYPPYPAQPDSGAPDATFGVSDATVPSSSGAVASTAQLLSECAGSGAGAGGLGGGPGPGQTVNCSPNTSILCFGNGRGVRATFTPLDCEPMRGFTGDPARVHTHCEAALDGHSGERCETAWSCSRVVAGDACCLELAMCKLGSPLRRFRACPSACPGPGASSVFVAGCSDMAALWQIDASRGAWLGATCMGSFVCPSARSLLAQAGTHITDQDLYYCANGALQMMPVFLPSL